MFAKLFIPFSVLLFIVACGPRDVVVESKRGGFGGKKSGQAPYTLFSEKGELPPTCTGGKKAWRSVTVNEDDKDKILAGNLKATMGAGNLNCFQIGSTVDLKVKGQDEVFAKLVIEKSEATSIDSIGQRQAKAFSMGVDDVKDYAQGVVDQFKNSEKGFDVNGIVTVTYFSLEGVVNTPVGEAQQLLLIDQEGERSPTCPESKNDYARITIPANQDADIKSGKVLATMGAGDMNCFRVGAVVDFKDKAKDAPVRGQVKITWIEIVPLEMLTEDHAALLNISLSDLNDQAKKAAASSKGAKDIVNFTVFEYVKN